MAKRTQHTIGLDIGTSRVTCIAGEPGEGGLLEVVGIGEAEARGLAQGSDRQSRRCSRRDQEGGRRSGTNERARS